LSSFAEPEKVVLLALEADDHPMHLGVVQLFAPPADAGPEYARQTYDAMRTRTAVARTFTGHPALTRRGTSKLKWAHDDGIDIDYHWRYLRLRAPGGHEQLFETLGELHSSMLDRRKPLWEAYLIDGLENGAFAVYIKAHHALADGTSGANVIQGALSRDPADTTVRASWEPLERSRSGVTRPKRDHPAPSEGKFAHAVRETRRSASLIRELYRDRELVPALRAPRTIFGIAPGGPRRCALGSWPLPRITEVAKKADVTVNDVALAMCAGALREYLVKRGELPERSLVAMAPVNIRDDEDADAGNIAGGAVCTLATDVDDPAQRLRLIHKSMRRNVEIIRQLPRQVAIHMFGIVCAPLSSDRGLGARIPPVFNIVVSHMRGVGVPLYRNGARLVATYPLPPTLKGQAFNVGLFSSGETIDFGLVSSERAVPDVECMIDHLETALEELEHAVGL
jgi:diacylglycerol O-acyltransferase / wax synthase